MAVMALDFLDEINMTLLNRMREKKLADNRFQVLLDEMRQAREPAGSGKGGQFANKNSGAAVAAEMTATPATVGGYGLSGDEARLIEDTFRESYDASGVSASTMSADEEENLQNYRERGYIETNLRLRYPDLQFGEPVDLAIHNARVKGMDDVIDRSPPLAQDMVVYRGVGVKAANALGLRDETTGAVKPAVVGKVIVDDAFISTTLRSGESENFSTAGIVLEITVSKGGKALSMNVAEDNTRGAYTAEREFLLPRSSAMVVTGSRQEGKVTIMEVSVTP